MNLESQIIQLIATHLKLNPNDITAKSNLRSELDADSIHIVEISMLLESTFNISISTEETDRFVSVQNLIDHVSEKTKL